MRTEPISIMRRLIECDRKPITVSEAATAILPEIKTILERQGIHAPSLSDVCGAFVQFSYNEGLQIGSTIGDLSRINSFHVQAGHGGFSEDEMSFMGTIIAESRPSALLTKLTHDECAYSVPEEIYNRLRLAQYEYLSSI